MANILVVDDEHGIRDLLFEILNDVGHQVELAENAAQAREVRNRGCPDLVLLDIWMPDTDGVSLLKEWAGNGQLTMPVVMMSGHATIETAVEATKLGALSFLEKPITLQKLMQAVDVGLKKAVLKAAAPHLVKAHQPLTMSVLTSVPMPATDSHEPAPQHRNPDLLLRLDQPLREAKEAFDKAYFSYHLEIENGSVAKVAEKTGIERTHLYRKLKQLGIDAVRNKHHD
ncbi:MAG: response regulator [Cytophagales bacterium]|nr:response regulator [Cytophagales bacterium]